MKMFTIYTPVYNSAGTFKRVYDSLNNQTFKDFEWIIINDGSVDASSEVIRKLILNSSLDITFIDLKENIGFNKSFNMAVNKAKGKFFLISHSDDEITKDALQIFYDKWEKLDKKNKELLQGIKCNCDDQFGNLIGDPFPEDEWISDIFELLYIRKIKGEKWGFIKTEIIKKYLFPEDQKFTSEGVIWHRIFYKYPALFINKSLRIYYVNENPQSLSKVTEKNKIYAYGKRMLPLDFINYYFPKVNYNLILIISIFVNFWSYSFISRIKIIDSLKDIISFKMKLLSVFFIIPGYFKSKI